MAGSNPKGTRRPAPAHDNFLEALRDLGKGVVVDAADQFKQAITSDIPQSFGHSSGTLRPNEDFSLADVQQAEKRGEQRAESRFNARLHQIREEERVLSQRREGEIKAQIKSIQEEIKLLTKSAGDFAHEVEVAAFQAPVNPGIYHQNFFEQLRNFIKTMRQRIQDSKHWLATTNARASKRSHYWNQVGKSGTKYMLSQERYMVTSTG